MSHALGVIKRFYDLVPRGIIHVGANRGQEVDEYRKAGITPVALIEPLSDPFNRLLKAVDGAPGIYPIQACCSSVTGRVLDFHVASNSGQSSSYMRPGLALSTLYPQLSFQDTVQVTTKTLDDVLNELEKASGVSPNLFDYLGIDTQGSEHDVLAGATKTLKHIKFAWIEVSYGGLYEGDKTLYEMIDLMRALGFDLYYLVMRTKRWGDALFIRQGVVSSQ